jgi:hypothetical protein
METYRMTWKPTFSKYFEQQILNSADSGCWDDIAPPDSEGSEKRTERQPINTPGFEKQTTAIDS